MIIRFKRKYGVFLGIMIAWGLLFYNGAVSRVYTDIMTVDIHSAVYLNWWMITGLSFLANALSIYVVVRYLPFLTNLINDGNTFPGMLNDLNGPKDLIHSDSVVSVYCNDNDNWTLAEIKDKEYLNSLNFNYDVSTHAESCANSTSLLLGPIGSGKRTICYVKANILNKDVYVLNMASIIGNKTLKTLIDSLPPDTLLVIEDIEKTPTLLKKWYPDMMCCVFKNKDSIGVTKDFFNLSLNRLRTNNRTVVVALQNINRINKSISSKTNFDFIVSLGPLNVPVIIDYIMKRFKININVDIDWKPILAIELIELVKGCGSDAEMLKRLENKFNK